MKREINIVGGGLTGLSLSIALRKRGVTIHLHEAGFYPRHRVCGEFISGVSSETLNYLGILGDLADARRHSSVAWFSGDDYLRDACLPSPALGISRYLLDQRLYQRALELGCHVFTNSRKPMLRDRAGDVWTAGRKPVKGKWVGLKAHIRGLNLRAELEMHSGPWGYLGITPVEEDWCNVCGLFEMDRSLSAQHHDLLPAYLEKNGNQALAERIRGAEWREHSFTAVAGFALGLQAPSPGILVLGDSHAIIPPFTGNGMSMAFQSSEIAVPHLLAYAKGERTWNEACYEIRYALKRSFARRLFTAKFLHPFLFCSASKPLLKHAPLQSLFCLTR